MMKLKNKVAVVTGAGRGIGRSIALAFAREGAHVVLAARSRDQLDQVAEEIKPMGTRALAVPCDVSVAQDVQALAKVVHDEFGRLNITVNAICPFFVNTEMFIGPQGYVAQMTKNMNLSEEEVTEKVVARNLQSRILEPEEIASLVLYLASEDSRGITGQALNVCGGNVFH
jgi:NAD(P)-dependent dehydrogenase (short-subunit alcohol dehydrogenase family)